MMEQFPNSMNASVQSRLTMGSRRKDVTEAEEAELLSRATSQAMIAARSILMSGGSPATALSTAKAAAQSILVPDTSEMDGPALGKVFLSKRKAKRQADVVASMALLSVKQQLVSYQGGIPNYPFDGNNSFLQGSVASVQPPSPAHPVGRGMPRGEFGNNASYDNTSYAQGNNYTERNHDRVQRFQPQKQQSGKSTRQYQQPKSPQELKEQLKQQSMESPQSSRKLPGNLPKARVKSPTMPRDLAKGVPEEDPIYSTKNQRDQEKYLGVADDSSSSDSESGTFGSGTIGSDTAEANTVVPHVDTLARSGGVGGDDGFMSSVDPLLSTLTNVFFCGGPSPTPFEKTSSFRRSSSRGVGSNQESRQDDEGSSSDSEGDEDDRASPASHRRARGTSPRAHASSRHRYADSRGSPRGHASHSTADSEQLLKELNLSSTDDEERNGARRRDEASGFLARSTIRESMEQVVLRALSGTLTTPTPPPLLPRVYDKQSATAEKPATMTVDAKPKESDAMSATSSLSTANRSRMAVMAQRVKFRKWMRRRRGLTTPQDE